MSIHTITTKEPVTPATSVDGTSANSRPRARPIEQPNSRASFYAVPPYHIWKITCLQPCVHLHINLRPILNSFT